MVNSFAADFNRVATLQYTNSVGGARMRWIGVDEGHHELSHNPDTDEKSKEKLTKINKWFCEQLAYLVKRLAETPEPGRGRQPARQYDHCLDQRAGQGELAHFGQHPPGWLSATVATSRWVGRSSIRRSPTTVCCSRLLMAWVTISRASAIPTSAATARSPAWSENQEDGTTKTPRPPRSRREKKEQKSNVLFPLSLRI